MKKYIKSTSGNLIYEIERQSFTEKFRTPEDYFTHATRNVWYSTTGFNMFVQYKGAYYMIDRTDAHGYITTLEFSPVTAEEAAAAKMERAAQAMSEAQEHEAKTAAAALDYDTETAEAEAREARFAADYAEILARESAELAAVEAAAPEALASEGNPEDAVNLIAYTAFAGINDGATPDTYDNNDMEQLERLMGYASEIVRRDGPAHGIQWTPYQRYELEAFLVEPDNYDVDAIEAEATAHQWTPDETRAEIKYRAEIAAANRAALALLDAYAEAIGEHPAEDDPETEAAYRVARDELTGTSQRASKYDRETVALMVEAIARAASPADIAQYADMHYLVWTRAEVLAYIGDPTVYDVNAILQDIEETGASLADAAERHELYQYAPVA